MRCPVHRRFFLIRRSSIDGSSVRSSISLFVTLAIQVIRMIERRCRIMTACSFFTCRLYTVEASAPYRRVDSTITQYIVFPSTVISSSRVLVELGWYSNSVFLMLVFRPNFFDASQKASTIFCISSAECATSALSYANSRSLISIRVVLVFALKCTCDVQ